MKRRIFLHKSAIGLPMVMLGSSLVFDACNENDHKDNNGKTVVIIGAGIAGLAAAVKLKEHGFTVIVLEAQDKVGGRLRTDRSHGIAFDEGASWIHGIDGNPLMTLAEQSGMETFFTDDESILSYDIMGKLRDDAVYDEAAIAFSKVLGELKNSGADNKSFLDVFNVLYPTKVNDRLWKYFMSVWLTFDGGDIDKLSSTLYDEGEEFMGIEKIAINGYETIPLFLAKEIDVRLNERVTKINYNGNKIIVTHNGNEVAADHAIITVPLGVLKANSIQFDPPLPQSKQTAIDTIGMNCVNKFLLIFPSSFWDDAQYITYTPEEKDKFNYFVNVKKFHPSVNALMTFAYADYGRLTETMTDTQLIEKIMGHLRDIYGNTIPLPIKFLRTKWQSNQNSFGAYSYISVATKMHHFDDLAEEIGNRLFFAGEHTHADYFSTAHGAYLSGIREADKIIG